MQNLITTVALLSCAACSSHNGKNEDTRILASPDTSTELTATNTCPGDIELPDAFADKFIAAKDEALLQRSLGQEDAGKLCQAKVYQARDDTKITIYRSWNSTNPDSQMGNWWVAKRPEGKVANYRIDYEICYQWSPLDMMSQCTLKPGTKVVIGTGQSAVCSEYLSYRASDKKQVYIENASEAVINCSDFDASFAWESVAK